MADLSPTQYVFTKGQLDNSRLAAVNLTKGDWVHLDATNEWDKANNATALEAGSNGLAMVETTATAGNPVTVVYGQAEVDLGTSIGTKTDEIVLSSTDGKMHPKGDLASTELYTRVGYMKTADVLVIQPFVSGVAK